MTYVPNVDRQLLGGPFSPLSLVLPSCQMYQSRLGLFFELLLSLNQACCRVNKSPQDGVVKAYLVTAVVDNEVHD